MFKAQLVTMEIQVLFLITKAHYRLVSAKKGWQRPPREPSSAITEQSSTSSNNAHPGTHAPCSVLSSFLPSLWKSYGGGGCSCQEQTSSVGWPAYAGSRWHSLVLTTELISCYPLKVPPTWVLTSIFFWGSTAIFLLCISRLIICH